MAKSLEPHLTRLRAVHGRALGANRQKIAPPAGTSSFAKGWMRALGQAGNGAWWSVAAFCGSKALGHQHSPILVQLGMGLQTFLGDKRLSYSEGSRPSIRNGKKAAKAHFIAVCGYSHEKNFQILELFNIMDKQKKQRAITGRQSQDSFKWERPLRARISHH